MIMLLNSIQNLGRSLYMIELILGPLQRAQRSPAGPRPHTTARPSPSRSGGRRVLQYDLASCQPSASP